MLTTIKAVIFDMDGVIFDSEKVYYDAFYRAADINEYEVDEELVLSFSGKTTETCLLMLQNYFDNDIDKTQRFCEDWGRARMDILAEQGLPFKEGFISLFDAIKQSGRDIGMVTSASYADMQENFERNYIDLLDDFTHIVTIEDVKYPKPHPQPYKMMMRQLGHEPSECVVIEDSVTGVTAAVDAEANTIMINEYTAPPPELARKLLYHAEHHDDILTFLQSKGL